MKKRKQIKKEIETAKSTTKSYRKRDLNRNLYRRWYYQPFNRSQQRHPKNAPFFNFYLTRPRRRILILAIGLAVIAIAGIVFYANLFLHFNIRFRL